MRFFLLSTVFALTTAACMTPFPPGVVDPGRGAAPMPIGTTTVGGSFGAGISLLPQSVTNQDIPVVGGGATLRAHTQVDANTAALGEFLVMGLPPQRAFNGDTIIGTSVKGGIQRQLLGEHLALRVLGGGGTGSKIPLGSTTISQWWLHLEAETGVVASFSLLDDTLTPYGALSCAVTTPNISNIDFIQLYPGVAVGATYAVFDDVDVSLAIVGQAVAAGFAAEAYAAHAHLGVRMEL